MASSLSLRQLVHPPTLFSKLLNPTRHASLTLPTSRFLNTDSQVTGDNEGDRAVDIDCPPESAVDVNRRPGSTLTRRSDYFPGFLDVFDPFSPTRTVTQLMSMMDQLIALDPILGGSRGVVAGANRRAWDVKEDDRNLYLRADMPGLEKDDVKITVQQNTLIIRGEEKKKSEDEDEDARRRYSCRFELPSSLYKLDSIKAEMKNGVLKLVVPKVEEEERKDVKEVKVE